MKSVIVHVNDDDGMAARLDAALDIVRAHDGHLTCLQATFQFTPTAFLPMGGDMISGLSFDDIQAAEKELSNSLKEKLKDEDVSWDWKMGLGDPATLLAEQSGLADLLVVSRAHGKRDDLTQPLPIAGEVVLHAPTACLMVTAKQSRIDPKAPVVIAWNGSGEAGRAVRYTLPMLKMASEVHLVMVEEEGRDFPDISASEYLSRHGIKSELHQISSEKSQIAEILENFAAERGASAIVMGAYGHSRMRETLFGGVTKSMLDTCEIPLIVAH